MASLQLQDEKVYFSENRILYFLIVLVASAIAPWFITAFFILMGFFLFEIYTEGVFIALVFDVVYGPGAGIFSGFIVTLSVLALYSIFYVLDVQPFAHARNGV